MLGTIYSPTIDQHFAEMGFPLLDNFVQKFQSDQIKLDIVIVILTDQTEFFEKDSKKVTCPYWCDTIALKPIIGKYLEQNLKVKSEHQIFITLKPENNDEGLDDWNTVLKVVQEEFIKLSFDSDDSIYVSHQAGTPAISSAVQFISLTRFGKQVNFLIGSEHATASTKFIKSSTYLRGLQIQEAKSLLRQYDYAGIKTILKPEPEVRLDPYLESLLDAAILWNYGEFNRFKQALNNMPALHRLPDKDRHVTDEWWCPAYESAYLAVIRLKQENTVEAMFHSFRAVEGLMKKYVMHLCDDPSVTEVSMEGKKVRLSSPTATRPKYKLFGSELYEFLRDYRNVTNADYDIYEFGNKVFNERNELFHNLIGLNTADSVFQKWSTSAEEEWQSRVLGCLNFISSQTFSSLEEASIMPTIHIELKNTLNQLPTPQPDRPQIPSREQG